MRSYIFCSIFLVFPSVVLACSCFGNESVEKSFESADLVFAGKVESTNEGKRTETNMRQTSFFVLRTWKGNFDAANIRLNESKHNCRFHFENGASYLVYAYTDPLNEGGFTTTTCSRTGPIAEARSDIDILELVHRE